MTLSFRSAVSAVALLLCCAQGAQAGEVNVAVAANFTEPAKEIAKAFEAASGHKAVLSFGATGQLYTQITQDAPFGAFLSADDATVKKAVDAGFAVTGSRFTYAVGTLVLWSKDANRPVNDEALRAGKFEKLAIANPKTAPYGAAAVAALTKMGVYDAVAPKLVQGANIVQTFQFVDTGNAELGFVAASQVIRQGGARWAVPALLHDPIRQDAALLTKGAENPAAKAFIDFLKGPEAIKVIESYGYGVTAAK